MLEGPHRKLVTVMLQARKAPKTLAIALARNPEYMEEKELSLLADDVLDEAVQHLLTGRVSTPQLG
jgi:hypothetical protein